MLGEWRIGIFANRDIAAGEELSYDYNFQSFGLRHKRCFCGEANCRGFLTSKPRGESNGARKGKRKLLVSPAQEEMKRLVSEIKKGLSARARSQIIKSRVFLARNFGQVRSAFLAEDARKYEFEDPELSTTFITEPGMLEAFKGKLAALSSGTVRSIRTRTVATMDADEQLEKMAQLAFILKRRVHESVVAYQSACIHKKGIK